MWQYIVLGQIPGTSIYISFYDWLSLITFLGGCYILYKVLSPTKKLKNYRRTQALISQISI